MIEGLSHVATTMVLPYLAFFAVVAGLCRLIHLRRAARTDAPAAEDAPRAGASQARAPSSATGGRSLRWTACTGIAVAVVILAAAPFCPPATAIVGSHSPGLLAAVAVMMGGIAATFSHTAFRVIFAERPASSSR